VKDYFITGGTGVLGNEIAARLLAQGDCHVRLLVRADTDAKAAHRVRDLVAYWQMDPAAVEGRLHVLRGDATLPRFGFAESDYAMLSRTTTHVVHCAALVRMNLPLPEARQSAVGAARNVLALAEAARAAGALEKVEFVSTVGVGGRRDDALEERWITEPRSFHNSYEQAKAEAEELVALACERGLPLTVHRPSMVVGDSTTGRIIRFQIFYHIVEFLSGRRTRGLFPSFGDARLDLIPVDVVAGTVCWSSRTGQTTGRILHLCSGPRDAISLVELRDRIRAKLRAIGATPARPITVPMPLLRAVLPVVRMLVPERHKRALDTLPVFLDYLAGRQAFANEATVRLLGAAGISIPPPRDYLAPVLDNYLANRREGT